MFEIERHVRSVSGGSPLTRHLMETDGIGDPLPGAATRAMETFYGQHIAKHPDALDHHLSAVKVNTLRVTGWRGPTHQPSTHWRTVGAALRMLQVYLIPVYGAVLPVHVLH